MEKHICYYCFKDKGEYEVCAYCGHVEDENPMEAYHLRPGTLLNDRYLIGKSIGFGGFGITYRAYDQTLATIVAVKEFYPAGLVNRAVGEDRVGVFSGDKQEEYKIQLERFLEEARNMAAFSAEKDIVNVYDYFEANGTAYIIMEYIEGELLKTHLKEEGAFSVEEATTITLSILEAIGKIHKKNIIHKDISPDNIFLLGEDRIKIFDFGAAKFAQSESEKTLSAVVKSGYAPPEQYRSKGKSGPYMDLYAVGAVFYEMLTGVKPMESPDRAVEDELEVPSHYSDKISKTLDTIVMKAMAVRPELRFQSANEFIQALKQNRMYLSPDEELQRRLKRRRLIMGVTGVASCLLLVGIVLLSTVFSSRNKLSGKEIKEAEISVWLKTDNEKVKESLEKVFAEDYPQIQAEITCYGTDVYDTKLEEAKKTNALPDVYCTDSLSEKEVAENAASLDLLLASLNQTDYRYYQEYETLCPDKQQIPTGYQVTVAYENADKENPLGEKAALKETELMKADAGLVADAEKMEAEDYAALGQKEDPLAVVTGDLSVIDQVKDVTINQIPPANLKIVPVLKEEKLLAEFAECYAVNAGSGKKEQYASMMLLSYLLSDGIESLLYMDGYQAIPVNQAAYESYKEVKMTSYLKFMEEYEEKMAFESL